MKVQILKNEILKMTRDQLINFLAEHWTEGKERCPTDDFRYYLESHPGPYREIALELIVQMFKNQILKEQILKMTRVEL